MLLFLFILLFILNISFIFRIHSLSFMSVLYSIIPALNFVYSLFIFIFDKVQLHLSIYKEEKKIKKEILRLMSSVKSYLQVGLLTIQSLEMTIAQRRWCSPIETILKRVLQSCQRGKTLEESLNDGMKYATKNSSYQYLRTFIGVLRLSHKTGGNTVAMLDRVQNKISDHLYLQQKIKTLTAQMRLQAIVIFISPWVLAFIIYCLSPNYILFFVNEPLGVVLLVLMLLFNFFAFLSLSYILRIQ